MQKELEESWVKALRSGEYEQGQGALCNNGQYCCLGVLAEITGNLKPYQDTPYKSMGQYVFFPGMDFFQEVGLSDWDGYTLAEMNDGGSTFKEIADYIEKKV